ncbi:hypothetical protein D3C74_370170 [compost metagenome]
MTCHSLDFSIISIFEFCFLLYYTSITSTLFLREAMVMMAAITVSNIKIRIIAKPHFTPITLKIMLQNIEDNMTADKMVTGTDFFIKPTPTAIIPSMDIITAIIKVFVITEMNISAVKLNSMKEKYKSDKPNTEKINKLLKVKAIAASVKT